MSKSDQPYTDAIDAIRQAVRESGLTQYRIAKELDVAESTMSRFMKGVGQRGEKTVLSPRLMDKLAALLGIRIDVTVPKAKQGRKV